MSTDELKPQSLRHAIRIGMTATPLFMIENSIVSQVKMYLFHAVSKQIRVAQNHDELELLKKLIDLIASEE